MRGRLRTVLLCLTATASVFGVARSAAADDDGTAAPQVRGPAIATTVVVSDQDQGIHDANAVNPWGLAIGPTSPLWVANNGTSTATLYRGGGSAGAAAIVPLVVTVPGGAPTGQAFNGGTAFLVPGNGQPARFLFDTENGDLSVWNGQAGTMAVSVAHSATAVYKGLTISNSPFGPLLLAANFHDNAVEVYDGQFNKLAVSDFLFRDWSMPPGYAPFNVSAIGDHVFVTYARQDREGHDEVAGEGRGFVDEYTSFGVLIRRFASRGPLNAPWGMAIAPSSFGRFAGSLLVGNFGDGRINAYDLRSGRLLGPLRGPDHRPVVIDGLWGLLDGTAVAGGTDAVWFSAGNDDEAHGQVGLIHVAG
jgi:uncharacterized protein (TIGR03118 family)